MRHGLLGVGGAVDDLAPLVQVGGRGVEAEVVADDVVDALLGVPERHLVDVVDVLGRDDRLGPAARRTARSSCGCRWTSSPSERQSSMSGWMPMRRSSLTECCVGFVFSSPAWPMYGTSVRWMYMQLRRPTSTGNWRIASRNGSDSMSPTVPPISVMTTSTSLRLGDQADALLDLVGDVRDDLDGAAEVVAAALAADDRVVDPAGGDVRRARRVRVREALVVAEVEVGLGAVLGDEDLAVLVGRHRARVDVDVRVELLQADGRARGPRAGGRSRRRRCPCRATRRRRR